MYPNGEDVNAIDGRHLTANRGGRVKRKHFEGLARGDFLVDDRTKNGTDRFVGELILFGSPHFPDWQTVTDYVLTKI